MNKTIASTLNTGEGSRRCDASNYVCKDLPENADLQKLDDYIIGDFRYDEGFRPRKNGLCPCLTTKVGGASLSANPLYVTRKEEIMENKVIQDGYIKKGENGTKHQSNTVCNVNGLSPTLCAGDYKSPLKFTSIEELCIRKLTPKECYRLMGFSDELFNKIEGISNTQLYKQAGNSIVTDMLLYIYIELYKAMPEIFDDLKVLSLFSGIGAFEVGLDRLYRVINLLEDKKR